MTTTTLEILHISLAGDGPAVVVRLEGDVDFGSGPRLAERLSEVVDAGTQIVVDLAGVGFVDPAGLAALLAASKAAARCGASFVLRAPQRPGARLLATTGADRLVTIEW